MALKDLKVGNQLRFGFGLVLLLVLLLSTFAWWQTYLLVEDSRTMYEHPLQVRKAVSELKFSISQMRLEYRNFLLSHSSEQKTLILKKTENLEAESRRQMNILQDRYLGPPQDIENLRRAFTNWIELRYSNLNIKEDYEIPNALKRVEESGDIGIARQELMRCVSVVEDFAIKKSLDLMAEATTIQRTFTERLIFMILFIVLLMGWLIFLLLRNIRNPIQELKRASEQFNNGKTDVRSDYNSKNEFGDLSRSLNTLFEVLESDLQIKNNVEIISRSMLNENEAALFCKQLIESLMLHTNSQMGAFYVLDNATNCFTCFSSIGIDRDCCRSFSAETFEGQIGLPLSTSNMQHITDIPENTPFQYATVSGILKPVEMVTLPISNGQIVFAVITLFTIKKYHKNDITVLETLKDTINARTNAVFYLSRLKQISVELEKKNELLEKQKNEVSELAIELKQQNEELEFQKVQLNEANNLKTTFLSRMSHELRTPLNSVIALSGVLSRRLKDKVSNDEYGYLEVIERNGKQLLDIINDILDISRIEAGKESINVTTFNLSEMIKEMMGMLQHQADTKNIQLTLSSDSENKTISSDFDKCMHILQNILSNAVKFTEDGSVSVEIFSENQSTKIRISDTGIGMSPEFLPFIFDEFRQAENKYAKQKGGTGLGMAIAQKYTILLGGTLQVSSELGKGSVFTLTLPHLPSDENSYENRYSIGKVLDVKVPNIQQNVQQPSTLLLVEDSEPMMLQMQEILQEAGYTLLTARNGIEALDSLSKMTPDAVILDLMMPEVNGFEVLKKIRENPATQWLPVMILTSKYVSKEELFFLKNNGIYQLIRKGGILKEPLLKEVYKMVLTGTENVKKPIHENPGRKILIVEDNPDNVLTIQALIGEDFEIVVAEDGLDGVEMSLQQRPDLILMDIALPRMNGVDAMKKIKERAETKHIPIVVVTASALSQDKDYFMAQGFDGYLAKPIDEELFEQLLNTIF